METSTKRQNVELKLARLEDAKQIALMSRELVEVGLPWSWTAARVAAHIRGRDSDVLTAWADGQLIGFAIMQFFDEHAHLNLLAVDPACRRSGIGHRLIEWLEETARAGGIFFVNLEVRAGNGGARAFYRKLGYRETRYIPGYYGGREAAIRMTHDLRCSCPSNAT
ncbi:MAG: GNAT family N-acetyltransferase [Deltaproteobacteria bacterium]|nr:GNAT family N-acetyltransferase [Deltaproteobacteria bacterium]